MRVLNGNHQFEFGEFTLDANRKVLRRGGEIVSLPLKAVELLCVLIENHGEVVSKNDLIERVWKDSFVEDSVLTQNIYLLRKTLQTNGDKGLIKNVPRRGYLFGGEVRQILSELFAAADGTILTEDNGTTIIERHLFEKIEYEETDDAHNSAAEKAIAPLENKTQTSPRFYKIAFVGILLLTVLAGTVIYFRRDSRQTVSSPLPIKLKSVASPSAVKTLAVVPLKSADESLSNAFSSDLSNRLGSLNKFNVRPFAIVQKHAATGAKLESDFVLDGEIKSVKNQFRISVKLTDAKTGAEIWTEKFEYADQIQLQDAIANRAAQAITNTLSAEEREQISKKLPTNIAAYETFQNGYMLWRSRRDGTAYFKKAIELDSNFARAYVGLASWKMMNGGKDSPEAVEAEELLKKAFAIDDNLADAYAAQGFMLIFHRHDWENAEKSLKYALELDANNVNAHHWLGVLYSIHRRLDAAKTEMQIALELDPTNPTLLADLGQIYYFAGEKDSAIEYCKQALALDPNHTFANYYLSEINQPSATSDKEATLNQLEQANDNFFTLPYINVDPQYDKLRDEPRFRAILRKLNL
ncbi:MAG: winged helix-turn-helix domain-containing tetratricopeptide repeat protein [Pyrinomonadaceae bacterium]